MKTILFLPGGIGLAHVGRLIMVAKELQKKDVEVLFGVGEEGALVLERENLRFKILPEFPRSVYEKKLKKNNFFVYTRSLVKKFVLAELALYRREKPDLIIYDIRLTAKISAKIAGIPIVSIANVDVTPYYNFSKAKITAQTLFVKFLPKKILPLLEKKYSLKLLQKIGPNLLKAIFLEEIIRLTPAVFNLGYKPSFDPYQLFLGDLTLLCDIEQFRPMKELPENVKMVGPIFWEGENKRPSWEKELEGKEIIYLTAGGTGDKQTFLKILEYLKDTKYTVVATTGNTLSVDEFKICYPNLYVSDFLPGSWIMGKSKLVIFPGGNATCYQALSCGVPQICTPFHLDHEDNANQLERLGTGLIINPYVNFSKEILMQAIQKVVKNKKYQQKAQAFKAIINKQDGKKQAAEEIEKFLEAKAGSLI